MSVDILEYFTYVYYQSLIWDIIIWDMCYSILLGFIKFCLADLEIYEFTVCVIFTYIFSIYFVYIDSSAVYCYQHILTQGHHLDRVMKVGLIVAEKLYMPIKPSNNK